MLALNASIEAAKAGDSGRGFAVVAAKVRELAGQSQRSTDQVKQILENIRLATHKVILATEDGGKGAEVGVELAESTGKSVERLKRVIEDTASGSLEIEAAVRQEVVGIEQIAEALDQINSVTQGFTASTKQNTQAADQLVEIAGRLRDSVEAYRTA